jgi:DNA-binding transcriptional ArsR family regulator
VRTCPALGELHATEMEPRKVKWTLQELLAAKFPEAEWIIPGILPVGLSTLAGRPKMGKSWLALQIACAVGSGGRVLDRAVKQGKVLYLALEDSERRLQERLQKQGTTKGDVNFLLEWQVLGAGGLDTLRAAIEQERHRLAIIDTLSRALGGADQLDLAEMSVMIGALQDITKTSGAAILTIDHHKKLNGTFADPIDDIMGSTGKAANVDAALGLYRERGKHDATLRATGRDMEDVELAIKWDGQLCCWQLVGEAGEVRKESLQADIVDAIRELAEMGEITSTSNIAQHLGKDKGNVSREIAELLKAGKVIKGERDGRMVPYHLPEQELPL